MSLNIDLHKANTTRTTEEAIAGVTHGIIGPRQTFTFRARHFGLTLTHTTLISQYTTPTHFQDIMTKGAFKSFVHDHFFEETASNETLMHDVLKFTAPLGPLGWIAEIFVLRNYLRSFLDTSNQLIRQIAESPHGWQKFISVDDLRGS